jgi:TPR repeat protein
MSTLSLFRTPWPAAAVLCLCAWLPASAAEPGAVMPEQAYQLALEARTARDYSAMLAWLRQAGEADHLRAQELLASLLLSGGALYGGAVRADACEAERWVLRASAQGSTVARHQRVVLNGLRDLAGGRQGCAAAG